jgi:hypothetical protein
MGRSKPFFILLTGFGLAAGLLLPSCNSIQPASPRQETSLTSNSGCGGVLGGNSTLSTPGPSYGSSIFFYPVTVSSNETLVGLSTYYSSSSPVTYEMGVYADAAGLPATLLLQTGTNTSGPVTGWNSVNLSVNLPISTGKTYWLALHATNIQYQKVGASVTYAYQNGFSTFGSLPVNPTVTPSTSYVISYYGSTCP